MANFQQAIEWMNTGKKVSRKVWGKAVYVFINNLNIKDRHICHIGTYANDSEEMLRRDVLCDDWEIFIDLHNWSWALEQLEDGKKVRWKDWEYKYLYIDYGTKETRIHFNIKESIGERYINPVMTIEMYREIGWMLY